MKKLAILTFLLTGFIRMDAQKNEHYMLIGTYTSSGNSEGIYVYKFNSKTGDATPVSSVATGNPSYLTVSPDEKYVYAVHEVDRSNIGGSISAFSFDKTTGKLVEINRQFTGGDHPCYVEIDKTGKWVFAANYSSGSFSTFKVNNDGSLDSLALLIQNTGSGVNRERQDKPHVHCTYMSPDNQWLFVADLGIDQVNVYRFDPATGIKAQRSALLGTKPGSGPRHVTFHPNGKYGYLIEELTGEVIFFSFDKTTGNLATQQSISTIPAGQKGYAGSADIHVSPDGKFLYATNRGDFNTIVTYKIDPKTSTLTVVNTQSTAGKVPRNFNMDPSGNFLLVANQESDEIVIFKRNKKSGKLTDTGKRIKVGKPVCIKWAGMK